MWAFSDKSGRDLTVDAASRAGRCPLGLWASSMGALGLQCMAHVWMTAPERFGPMVVSWLYGFAAFVGTSCG